MKEPARAGQDLWVLGGCWIVRELGRYTVYCDGQPASDWQTLDAAALEANLLNAEGE